MTTSVEVMRICVLGYLDHIRAILADMQDATDAYEEHVASMQRMTAHISSMPHDPNLNVDAIPNMVIKMQELLEDAITSRQNYQKEVMRARSICHVTTEAAMLWAHFVERKTWREVGVQFGYDGSYCCTLSRRGYEPIYTAMPESFKHMENAL